MDWISIRRCSRLIGPGDLGDDMSMPWFGDENDVPRVVASLTDTEPEPVYTTFAIDWDLASFRTGHGSNTGWNSRAHSVSTCAYHFGCEACS